LSLAIETVELFKSFAKRRPLRELVTQPFRRGKRVEALRGVDLQIRQGEIFGLLGPNGAGKTTLLKILSCLILPDRGRALVNGIETTDENRVKAMIGLVHSDERSFYWRLTGQENLEFFARLYNVPGPNISSRIGELLERVEMSDAADRRFSDYSSGMKQRMAIARALLHDPPILLMDEPTRSLDPLSSRKLRQFVLDELQGRDRKTIVLASHDLPEVEALADRVGFLVRGKLRRMGTVAEVKGWGVAGTRYRVELAPGEASLVGEFRVVADETVDGVRRVTLELAAEQSFAAALRSLVDSGLSIQSIHREEPDLEDVFSRVIAASAEESAEEPA